MIISENLILRPFTLDDTGKVYIMSLEDGMKKWIPDQVYADENEAREVLEFLITCYDKPDPKIKPFVIGIELKGTDELIGHVGLSPLNGDVEIGYAVEEKHHRKGYATEAIKAMCQYALEKFNLDKIIGIVASENKGSVKALEKAEFCFIEEKERNAFGRTGLCLIYRYSLTI
jgi:[ribosomal protein S5]-alanine N-acetyltransferase